MEKRLVDVLDSKGLVIHTYPITLDESGGAATEVQFKAKALEAAAHGQLVPDAELGSLEPIPLDRRKCGKPLILKAFLSRSGSTGIGS